MRNNWGQFKLYTYCDPNYFIVMKLKIIYDYQLLDLAYPKYGLTCVSVAMPYRPELSQSCL
jgi:hypothetical protein